MPNLLGSIAQVASHSVDPLVPNCNTPRHATHGLDTQFQSTHFGAIISASHGMNTPLEQNINTISSVVIAMMCFIYVVAD